MPENEQQPEKTKVSQVIQANAKMLSDQEVSDIYARYGLVYNMPSSDEYKLCLLLAAAEKLLVKPNWGTVPVRQDLGNINKPKIKPTSQPEQPK